MDWAYDTKHEEGADGPDGERYYNYVRLVRGGKVTKTPDGDPSTINPDRVVVFPDGDTGGGGTGTGPDFSAGVDYLATIGITVTAAELEEIIGGPPAPTAAELVANFAAFDDTIEITVQQAQALLDVLDLQ